MGMGILLEFVTVSLSAFLCGQAFYFYLGSVDDFAKTYEQIVANADNPCGRQLSDFLFDLSGTGRPGSDAFGGR
jgi:hypothetical protein